MKFIAPIYSVYISKRHFREFEEWKTERRVYKKNEIIELSLTVITRYARKLLMNFDQLLIRSIF